MLSCDLRRRISPRLEDGVVGGLCECLDVEFWTLAGREDPEVVSPVTPGCRETAKATADWPPGGRFGQKLGARRCRAGSTA
jgi:hypothetical protein